MTILHKIKQDKDTSVIITFRTFKAMALLVIIWVNIVKNKENKTVSNYVFGNCFTPTYSMYTNLFKLASLERKYISFKVIFYADQCTSIRDL